MSLIGGVPGGVSGSLMALGLPLPESSVRASLPLPYPGVTRADGDDADDVVAGCELKRECEKGRGCMKPDVSDDGADAR